MCKATMTVPATGRTANFVTADLQMYIKFADSSRIDTFAPNYKR